MSQFAILILLCIMMMPIFSPVFGEWNEVGSEGSWLYIERTEWRATTAQEMGIKAYLNIVENFTGYTAKLNMTLFRMLRGDWYWSFSEENFWFIVTLWTPTQTFVVYIRISQVTNTWGIITDTRVIVGTKEDSTVTLTDPANSILDDFLVYDFLSGMNYLELWIWRDGDNLKVSVVNVRVDKPQAVSLCNQTVNVGESFFGNVSLYNNIAHGGYGEFIGGMNDTIYQNDTYIPDLPSTMGTSQRGLVDQFIWDVRNIAGNILPQFMIDWLNLFGYWGGWLLGFISGLVISVTTTVLPFLPMLLIFWVIDVSFTALNTGNIQPFGNMVMTIYGFVVGVIGVLVSIATGIYDFVHFW